MDAVVDATPLLLGLADNAVTSIALALGEDVEVTGHPDPRHAVPGECLAQSDLGGRAVEEHFVEDEVHALSGDRGQSPEPRGLQSSKLGPDGDRTDRIEWMPPSRTKCSLGCAPMVASR